jgi:hypothetical protein
MFNFIGYVLKAPINFAKKFLSSPISTLFYGLVSKWYLVTMTLSVIVLYWVIKGLTEAGVIELAFNAFYDAGHQIKGFAQHCTPKIMDINKFLQCLMDTPEYVGDEVTDLFEEDIKRSMDEYVNHPVNHEKIYLLSPYDLLYDNVKTPAIDPSLSPEASQSK